MRVDQTMNDSTMKDLGNFSSSREAITAIYQQAVAERRETVGIVRRSWWLIRPRRVIRIKVSFSSRGLPKISKRRISIERSQREQISYCASVESSLTVGLWRALRRPLKLSLPTMTH